MRYAVHRICFIGTDRIELIATDWPTDAAAGAALNELHRRLHSVPPEVRAHPKGPDGAYHPMLEEHFVRAMDAGVNRMPKRRFRLLKPRHMRLDIKIHNTR